MISTPVTRNLDTILLTKENEENAGKEFVSFRSNT